MSKAPDSPARSRSRSRSRSYSRSHSKSRSRSRSRKRRYSSRSRSRSRSHSPSYRNYPSRDYQNNRGGFRGYNRGYRRPYHYRGRNRGYYQRGHYQNRGGGYGYKANWQGGGGGGGGGWHDRHHDQDHHSHSPRRGRSRSRTPKKRSGSRSRSRFSDRSSSGRSRHSRRSSFSSRSRSPSPRHRSSKAKPGSRDKEKVAESPAEKPGQAADGSAIEKASGGKWIDYDASPKRSSPEAKKDEAADAKVPAGGGSLWKTVGSVSPPPSKSPTKSGQTASFSGFGFFSKEDAKSGDKTVISAAFKKFLAENKGKKQASEKENGREKEQISAEREAEKSSKSGDVFSISSASFTDSKDDKTLPFFDAGEEEFLKSHGLKERDMEEEGEAKPALTARDIFGKWGDEPSYPTSYPSAKEKGRREAEEAEPVDHLDEEMYRSRKHGSKKEEKSKKKEKKEKEKPRRSPTPPSTSREKDRPLFPGAFPPREQSPVRHLSASREEFELKIGSLEEMPSSSLSKDRSLPRDLLNPSKKDPEFRSIFQNIQSAQLRRSPSELFAQHIVSIVHYIKAQHFPSSDMTLSERFAMYQRKAAEVEMMKARKSPEIHRRIDVSPSAFKRHSHLFEDVEETSYKDPSKKFKGDVMDLRLDIERRKRFAGKERDYKREGGRSPGGSRGPSRERSSEKSGKHHKKSKKGKKKRDRSPSSSSSSSSTSPYPPPFRGKEYLGEGMEHLEEGYSHPRYPPRDYSGPGDRGPREYEGHNAERGRGRGFVSSCFTFILCLLCSSS
ncbi:thyroid hormone receptor-associated protein 3b isoform X1 [Acanthochromis polyacanthus]|uniref:thyroid hormone receptor-associated protein 3b isoform X1 n=1 Tax=Acanthochromis polyacanthus TaxID=80966 RepID=UPI0022345D66|nr:thyroid hormone receptor-associated protein 3b isoform X1 [Acanthochromis polyacanthus]XP_051811343.1 thyroid hormone receptor-associated protein 3b isoform X1 [Acanthochromis polyacanthus]XP_051811344.1 thyroid hormone receptor-associated protein 3b isoform X1 [Acanthochromis polyacanthus]XP_051811346.1 thyroid hormone receptor-associated protein 3b isoform X1 [Acanthochromis polyacanthus]XP_051811347.1 thyroid hormone receptor-associated protein 3b isoform X1 [Acanthochromis polyacanthus]